MAANDKLDYLTSFIHIKGGSGEPKLYRVLQAAMEEAGVEMGRDRMFDTLRERGLLAPPPHRQWAQTTRRDLSLPVFRNEIEGLEVKRSNEAWVTDLTYVRTDAGFLYVSLITDKCSRKIVGYHADLMAPRSFGTHVRNRLKSEKQPNIGFFGQ